VKQDFGKADHWIKYYKESSINFSESSFARYAMDYLQPGQLIVDVGCGEGRDSYFFASQGFQVIGFDVSPAAIEKCEIRNRDASGSTFVSSEFNMGLLEKDVVPDIIYSRFSLHAMTNEEGDRFLARSYKALPGGGLMFIECRSINDPLAKKGEILSDTERIFGHYRRFIRIRDLTSLVEQLGFRIKLAEEVQGVSKSGSDDPVLIRAILEKPQPQR
jgi:cyclopropane fatty-acyl-phospholipid synthase-like methyltransferase